MESDLNRRSIKPRHGPRPLPLHLATALGFMNSSTAALPALKNGSLIWNASLRTRTDPLQAALKDADPETFEAFTRAVDLENRTRLDAMLSGVETYRAHPYERSVLDPPAVWQDGTTQLRDYGAIGHGNGQAVLVVPSLINRAYILDLSEDCSFMRWLARKGFRPFLVDWDEPGPAESGFDLTAYTAGRLESALDYVVQASGGPVAVVGYCMGGLLALALAVRRPDDVQSLTLLATPWDFHAERRAEAELIGQFAATLEPVLAMFGHLPVDILQTMFASLDPFLGPRKFARFAGQDPSSPAAQRFVALEDWLNDGVPLVAPSARECINGWYGANTPARVEWKIAGRPVDPATYEGPAYCVIPRADRIVPPASAAALADALPRAATLRPDAGHIGMITGQNVVGPIWRQVAAFMRSAAR